jgi:type IV pilus assembly protein PilP
VNARTVCLILALSLAGCGDDEGAAPKPAASAKKPRTKSPAGDSPTAEASAAASGLSSARLPPPPRRDFSEADFTETERTRDPFRSYARKFANEDEGSAEHSQREVLLKEFAVDDLKLIGIVTRVTPARAMLVDPTGRGHVVRRGQFIGRADLVRVAGQSGTTYELNWRLDSIRDGDVVLVREDPNNPDVPAATKVIPLRPEGTIIESGG